MCHDVRRPTLSLRIVHKLGQKRGVQDHVTQISLSTHDSKDATGGHRVALRRGFFLASHHHVTSVVDRFECGIQVERDGDAIELGEVQIFSTLSRDESNGRQQLLVPRLAATGAVKE